MTDGEFPSALGDICDALTSRRSDLARETARALLPFAPVSRTVRRHSKRDLLQTAVRDRFIDRYSGSRLVFPGTLRLLSALLPDELPYHPNWALDRCHPMYWDLYPTLDHVVPIARGGIDAPDNWVTTNQRMNSAKAHWTLEELGWQLVPAGCVEEWDGLLGWFVEYTNAFRTLRWRFSPQRNWRDAVANGRLPRSDIALSMSRNAL